MPRSIQYLSHQADRVLIVTNPSAGARSNRPLVSELVDQLRNDGLDVQVLSDLQRLVDTIGTLGSDRVRAVVAAGGDGTVAAVVNVVEPGIAIAVLPLGTENLLAKYLDLSRETLDLCHAITHGTTVALDAGRAGNRIFMLMAGCGFDADVVRRLHERRQGHIRHLSYAKPILDSIRNYTYPAMRVYRDPIRREADPSAPAVVARWLFVANLPCYAGGLKIVPDADGTDGQLDVCALQHGSLAHGLRYLGGIFRGQHLEWDDCHYFRTNRLRIESDQNVPYQLDGDPGGQLPLEITALPARVKLIVSERWAHDKGFRHNPPSTRRP